MSQLRPFARFSSAFIVAAGLFAGSAAAATEAPATGARSAVVRYGDLDLRADAGVQALYGRLSTAAKRVCASNDKQVRAQMLQRSCYSEALDEAVAGMGSEALEAVHAARAAARPLPRLAVVTAR